MEESIKEIISHYKSYLMKKIDSHIDKMKIISNENIINYEKDAKNKSMGNFALVIEHLDELKIDNKSKDRIINQFLNLHDLFEELEQINIMKDVYIWKFIN